MRINTYTYSLVSMKKNKNKIVESVTIIACSSILLLIATAQENKLRAEQHLSVNHTVAKATTQSVNFIEDCFAQISQLVYNYHLLWIGLLVVPILILLTGGLFYLYNTYNVRN